MPERYQPHAAQIYSGGAYLYRRTKQNNVLHAGVDLSAPRGTVVFAPADGVVVAVERQNRSPFRGYGPQSIVLRDDEGLFHLLSHLEPSTHPPDPRDPKHLAAAVDGARFTAGQAIGQVGKYNHTHWELRRKFLKGDPMNDALVIANTLDPLAWLEGATNTVTVLPPLIVETPVPASPASPASQPGGNGPWMLLVLLMLLSD